MLYVHVPFCRELCPFCSFHRIKYREDVAQTYFDMLSVELDRYAESGFSFTTVYVGGGTPTVLPERLEEVLGHARELWPLKEVSVETTPGDLSPEGIKALQRGGVNRLSVGVQSFHNDLLASVNRLHKYGSGPEIQKRLREVIGVFDTVNVDLIFGFKGQTRAQLITDLEIAKDLQADQITCYPLMTSGGTMIGQETIGNMTHGMTAHGKTILDGINQRTMTGARRLENNRHYHNRKCLHNQSHSKAVGSTSAACSESCISCCGIGAMQRLSPKFIM